MNFSDYRVSLDIHEIGSQVFLTVKQGDTNRRLYVSLTESENPYVITEDCVAVFAATKADGNIIFNNCTIEDNVICYEFTPQTVAAVGNMDCEIRLYGAGNALITSPSFTMHTYASACPDSDMIESVTEITTLTSLIGEAGALIASVNSKLENGDFIPKFKIGTVSTLPAGNNATVEITGTGAEPELNFGIPMGPQGQAESLIPDTELSLESLKPVQNKVITEALNKKADAETVTNALNKKADTETVTQTLNQALAQKVDKENGKGLSANDFTDEYKKKLDGIADGANKYELGAGAVGTTNMADAAVTLAKLAADAKDAFAPAFTYGTSDLTAGTSALATGKLYFVYE